MSANARQRHGAAAVQIIDPFDDPVDYGLTILPGQLNEVGGWNAESTRAMGSWSQPLMSDELYGSRRMQLLDDVRRRLSQDPPYQVLDAGEEFVAVPIIMLSAPDVPGVEVEGSLKHSLAASGDFSFKVLGTGLSANAKLTVQYTSTVACVAGESLVLSVDVPVSWQRRAMLDNEDWNWLVVVPKPATDIHVGARKVAALPPCVEGESQYVSTIEAGAKPVKAAAQVTVESGAGFSVGFSAEDLGLDTAVTVKVEETVAVSFTATLPPGHVYQITRLQGPAGVRVREVTGRRQPGTGRTI